MSAQPAFDAPLRARLLCAAGSLVVTGLLMAALLGLFHQASPTHWLHPTPELLELATACQALPGRAERLQCTRAVVAAHHERLGRDVVVAHTR